jgi:holo-[acyl-carrier protein] synthase
MLNGIGVDILEIQRMQRSIDNFGSHLLERIFTPGEIAYCMGKHNVFQHFAARFAAKEALSKAMSTGLRGEFSWRDIEVVNDALGKPTIALHGPLRQKLAHQSIMLSISHSNTHVIAFVVMEER